MKKLLIAMLGLSSLTSFAMGLTPFMKCTGTNYYDEGVNIEVLTGESNGLSESVTTLLILERSTVDEKIEIEGEILNKPDLLGNLQFISNDDRTRFITSGTLFTLDNYAYRVNNLECSVLKTIFTSKGNPRS